MALVLSVREGEGFWIGDTLVLLEKILADRHYVLSVPSTGDRHEVVEDRMSEILPEVLASSGTSDRPRVARIVLEAPQQIKIRRTDRVAELGL